MRTIGGQPSVVARSPVMRAALEVCRLYARFNRPVVFVGPVGAGKTTLAEELYRAAGLPGSFIPVSAGELGETLYSDTLFGRMTGAFTGASSRRRGAFAEATGGVLLLDDLAFMPIGAQAAILRVMETGRYRPLGADDDRRANCRILFATTIDPRRLVASGRLLHDLHGRLGELVVSVPPLRLRLDDILPIAIKSGQAFADEHEFDAKVTLGEDAQQVVTCYDWPGNVRELRDVMERAVIHAGVRDGVVHIRTAHLPLRLREANPESTDRTTLTPELVEATLAQVQGNKSAAARALGVHRNTIGRYSRRRG